MLEGKQCWGASVARLSKPRWVCSHHHSNNTCRKRLDLNLSLESPSLPGPIPIP